MELQKINDTEFEKIERIRITKNDVLNLVEMKQREIQFLQQRIAQLEREVSDYQALLKG